MIEVIASAYCLLTGIDPVNPAQGCLDIDPQTGKLGFNPPAKNQPVGGLIGYVPQMFSSLYTPPASSSQYIRHLAGNFGIIKPVQAQTEPIRGGHRALLPIQDIWISLRNITYLIFVLIFIVIGLGIMLRIKIDPRTVMTIQNQIPRIIIALLLITFSYAIAGLMIDLMWVSTWAGINILTQSGDAKITNPNNCDGNKTLQIAAQDNINNTPLSYVNNVAEGPAKTFDAVGYEYCADGLDRIVTNVSRTMGNLVTDLLTNIITGGRGYQGLKCSVSGFITEGLGTAAENLWKFVKTGGGLIKEYKEERIGVSLSDCLIMFFVGPTGGIITILSMIIIFFAVLFLLFRVWFELLKAYVMVIIYAITGPLWIIMGLLPAKPLGFEKWMIRLFANLVIFPATALLFVFAVILMNAFNNPATVNGVIVDFVPPLIGNPSLGNFGSLLGFGVLLVAPSLLAIIKSSVHAVGKPGTMAAGAIGQGLAAGGAFPKGAGKTVWNRAFMPYNPMTRQIGYLHQAIGGAPNTKWFKFWHKAMGTGAAGVTDPRHLNP
jgi:hypothetical protein